MPLPTVTTQAVTEIAPTTSKANGTISATGNGNCGKRGFVYSLTSHADPGNVKPGASDYEFYVLMSGSFSYGSFFIELSSLLKNTKYYVRAFAYSKSGYSYGGQVDFTTLENVYPDAIYSPRAKTNKDGFNYNSSQSTKLFAPDISKLDDEVVAIETELGTNVKGVHADLKARLEWIESQLP